MKTGKTLKEIALELKQIRNNSKDYLIPSEALSFSEESKLAVNELGEFALTELAHSQLASRLDIPKAYYERMREYQPRLLASNVNTWLAQDESTRLVRTLNGQVRAVLSNKYRPLDNIDMLEAVLPTLEKSECRIESTEITGKKFYLKAVSNNLEFVLPEQTMEEAQRLGRFKTGGNEKRDDIVSAGLVCSNSEVGCGGLTIEPLIWRRVCSNGLIVAQSAFKKYHIGKSSSAEESFEFFRDETRLADDRALWLKVRDTISHVFEQVNFQAIVTKMGEAKADVIEHSGVKAIEVTQKMFKLSDNESESVLANLLSEGDLSRFGLMNAVTRASQGLDDYERATEFERLGGQILELPKSSWKQIAVAH